MMKKLSSRSTLVLGIFQAITIYSYCLYLSEASEIINAPVFSKREQPKGTNFSVLAKNTKWFSMQFSRVLMPKEEDDDEVVVEENEDKNDDDEDDEIETESPTLSPTHEPSHTNLQSSETPTESVLSEMIQATSSSSSVSSSKKEESAQLMQKKPLNGDLPLDEFSMKLYFSVSSLTSDINYNDFEEVMSWYLEEYFSAHWESVLAEPIISSGLSSQLELDDGSLSLVKKYFDVLESFSIESVDLDLTSFSTSRETTRNRRGLRNNSAQESSTPLGRRKLPVNKVVTTSFDGKVIVKSKKLDELEDEEDAEKYKEDRALLENVLLILEEQVIHLQKKAFSEAEEIPIATYIRVETSGSNEILTDVESVKVSFPGDEIIEESNNDNNNGGNGEGLPATGINAGSSSNSEEESKKDIIVRVVTALLTGIGGALIVAIIYAFIKRRKKRKNPKTKNDGTADLTDDMRSTINLKHKIRNNSDDDFDDLSSIGMGTAIFTSPKSVITAYTNIHQDRNNNNDDMSQVSFGYSVDGHSLATKQMPKYAKPDDDDDDDDDSYLFDSNPVRNAVKTKAKEARELQHQEQRNRRTLNQSNNNSKARNSRSLSRASARTRDDSVWTFSHMGMGAEDSILEEGFEICETNNHDGDLASSLDEMLLEGSVGGATNATGGSTLNGLSTHYSLNRGRSFGDRSIVSNITCDDDEDQHHINLQQQQKKHLVLPDIQNNVSQDTVAHKNHSTTTTSKTTTRINAASQQQQQPKPAAEINSFSYLSAPKALVKTISALSSEPGQIVTGRKQQSQWSLSNFMSATTNNNMGRRCDDTLSDAPSDEFTIQSPAKLSNNDHLVDEDQWNTYDQPADNDANIGISRVDSRFDEDSILEDLAVLDRSLKGKKKKAGASFKRRFG